jgi:hypothetical protein
VLERDGFDVDPMMMGSNTTAPATDGHLRCLFGAGGSTGGWGCALECCV